jgi:hypothetical protein
MNQRTLRIPSAPKHTGDESEATLQERAREHVDRHPGLHFLADVMRALHGGPDARRNAKTFFGAFAPREMMNAFAERPDLRARVVKAMTGSPAALLRRLGPDALAAQIDLLAIDDLPEAERSVRAEGDRALSVPELYLKYLDPLDVATYFPAASIWRYEGQDEWWRSEGDAGARALMAVELRSVRRHGIMTDSELLDLLGDETLERHLSVGFRTEMRKLARRAAAEGRPFTDANFFAGAGGSRDLVDEIVECVPLVQLRELVFQAAAMLGLREQGAAGEAPKIVRAAEVPSAAAPVTPAPVAALPRVGPKASPPSPPPAKPAPDRRAAKTPASEAMAKVDRALAGEDTAPPQPDDELAFVEEISERI